MQMKWLYVWTALEGGQAIGQVRHFVRVGERDDNMAMCEIAKREGIKHPPQDQYASEERRLRAAVSDPLGTKVLCICELDELPA